MKGPPLPRRPEQWLRSVLGDTPRAATIIGDLREEYAHKAPGSRRSFSYAAACASIALRYLPSTMLDAAVVDGRHAVRSLLRSRTYSVTSVATLALGIGIAATLLTLTYGSLLRPLPYPDSDHLVGWGQAPLTGPGSTTINSLAAANLRDLSQGIQGFSGLAGFAYRRATLTGSGSAQRLLVASVTGNYFDVLAARPLLGRTFELADDVAGAPPTVILGERLWRREFASRPDIVGSTITLDTVPHTVIGVMPKHLPWPGDPQAWSPMRWTSEQAGIRRQRAIEGIARLRPGVTIESASSELKARFAELAAAYPAENGQSTVNLRPLKDVIVGSLGPNSSLLPLLGGLASLMLLVAYLNLATLSIGRSEARRHEMALRQALGAAGWRQRLSTLSEAAILATAGAAGGALLAAWIIPVILTRYGASIARAETIGFDVSTVTIIVTSALAGAVLMAFAAGSRSMKSAQNLNRRAVTSVGRVRRWLVAAQVGLAGGLVFGAVLVGWMIAALARVDLGVPLGNAVTFSVGVPTQKYGTPAAINDFFARLEARAEAIPGVTGVGGTSRTPFMGGTNGDVANADDPGRKVPIAEWRSVTPGFFQAIGLSLVDGRAFQRESPDTRTAIVSEDLSKALFGTSRGAGKRIALGDGAPYSVIGVVKDIRDFGPARPGRPTVYLRHASQSGFASVPELTMVVRTSGPTPALSASLREAVASIDTDVPIRAVASLEEVARRSMGTNRTTAGTVLLTLAGVALALGAIGVFGVTAVSVERRTREIGVRLALGDTPAGILNLILTDGFKLTLAGVSLGLAASWIVHSLVKSFLIADVQPGLAAVGALTLGVLFAASLVASAVPARRAARLSPIDALRRD